MTDPLTSTGATMRIDGEPLLHEQDRLLHQRDRLVELLKADATSDELDTQLRELLARVEWRLLQMATPMHLAA